MSFQIGDVTDETLFELVDTTEPEAEFSLSWTPTRPCAWQMAASSAVSDPGIWEVAGA